MNSARTAAVAMLRSPDFFAHVRGALAREGLAGEGKVGASVFFVMISRFLPNPLRVALLEMTEGSAKYMVQRVGRLLHPGTICGACSEEGWSRLAGDPMHRIVYVREWWDGSREGRRFEISGNRLARVARRDRDGRIVETPETIKGRFACIAEQYPWEYPDKSRWLTIKLPAPPPSVSNATTKPLEDDEVTTWLEVQRLLQARATRTVVLPAWGDVVIEQMCQDERAARHLPSFLQAWKTMTLLRSFQPNAGDQKQELILADFEDLAITSQLLRGVFKEGRWFPSPAKVFDAVFPVGEERGVINPLTGKGVRYTRREDKPAQSVYVPFDVM